MALIIKLARIDVPQFAILKIDESTQELQIDAEADFSADKNHTVIRNSLKITYLEGQEIVMQTVVDGYYELAKESWDEMKSPDGDIVIPSGILQHLASITLGATRGIIYAKTEGTSLNRFLMPLINLSDFVKENLIIRKES